MINQMAFFANKHRGTRFRVIIPRRKFNVMFWKVLGVKKCQRPCFVTKLIHIYE